jgi:hypothetical protein
MKLDTALIDSRQMKEVDRHRSEACGSGLARGSNACKR